MVILVGWVFFMSEVLLYTAHSPFSPDAPDFLMGNRKVGGIGKMAAPASAGLPRS